MTPFRREAPAVFGGTSWGDLRVTFLLRAILSILLRPPSGPGTVLTSLTERYRLAEAIFCPSNFRGDMRKLLIFLGLLTVRLDALPDFKAPFTIDRIGASVLFDTLRITTFLINDGTTQAVSPLYPTAYTAVSVGVDSFSVLRQHKVTTLSAGFYLSFVDTITVIRGAGSVFTWCDPLGAWGEDGFGVGNNVRAQAYNFRPQVVRDTVVVYDTLVVKDTLVVIHKDTVKITERDTIRVTVRDTIIKKDTVRVTIRDTVVRVDTVKFCPPGPTLTKASARAWRPAVATTVYNAIGQPVWTGMLREGEYPPVRLRQGLHLLVQGSRVHRFRVAYKD